MKYEDIKNYHDHNKWLRQEREAGRTLGGGGSSWVARETRQQYDNYNKALHPDPRPYQPSQPTSNPRVNYGSDSFSAPSSGGHAGGNSGSGSVLFWVGGALVLLCFLGFLPVKTAVTLGVVAIAIALVVIVVKGIASLVFGHMRLISGLAIAGGIAWAYLHGYIH